MANKTINDLTAATAPALTDEIEIQKAGGGASEKATLQQVVDLVEIPEAGQGITNLTTSRTATAVTVNSDTGTDAAIPAADDTNAGVMTAAMKTKLDGIEAGATNVTDSEVNTLADARIVAAAGDTIAPLTGGKVPTGYIPAIALTSVQVAANQAAMLALTTQAGDVVVRTDENKTYMHNGGSAGTMADFTLLNTPSDAVNSVNSQTGDVVLDAADVGASPTGHDHSGVYSPTAHDHSGVYDPAGTASSAVASHAAASDPHNGYQKESEKGAAGGYASLDGSTKVPFAELPTGVGASEVAVGNHSHGAAGQSPYDAIVAATGGTHTTLGAAATAGALSIYVANGTYTETANVTLPAGAIVVGESQNAIINLNSLYVIDMSGDKAMLSNLTIQNPGSNGCVRMVSGNYHTIDNVYFNMGTTTNRRCIGIGTTSGITYWNIRNCFFDGTGTNNKGDMIGFTNGTNGIFSNNVSRGKWATWLNIASATNQDLLIQNNSLHSDNSSANTLISQSSFNGSEGIHIKNNKFYSGNAANGFVSIQATYCQIINNFMYQTSTTGGTLITTAGSNNMIASNYLLGGVSAINNSGAASAIIGNVITSIGSSNNAINNSGANTNISNNTVVSNNPAAGIYLNGADNCVISSNRISGGTTGINVTTGSDNTIVIGNHVVGPTTPLADTGTATIFRDNYGADASLEKDYRRLKNTSGATINAGEVVVLKSVAAGDEVTTTTTAGDNKVLGMAIAAVTTGSYGYFQVIGKTTVLKANGTTDIAIGDYLTTFTTAGIAAKAATGQTAFAIALEAYATDDSNGVIDALLITPRII